MTTLSETAAAAGLIDSDLLKLAPVGLTAADAISDLQRRFPSAFESFASLAQEYELTDPSALALARKGVPPRQAMDELKAHYPAAFKAPFDARTAPMTEVKARLQQMQDERFRRRNEHQTSLTMARLAQQYGGK